MHLLVHYNPYNHMLQRGCCQAPAVKVAENEQISGVCLRLGMVNSSLFIYALQFLLSRQQRDGTDLTWPDLTEWKLSLAGGSCD